MIELLVYNLYLFSPILRFDFINTCNHLNCYICQVWLNVYGWLPDQMSHDIIIFQSWEIARMWMVSNQMSRDNMIFQPGVIASMWLVVFQLLAYSRPEQHPWISRSCSVYLSYYFHFNSQSDSNKTMGLISDLCFSRKHNLSIGLKFC